MKPTQAVTLAEAAAFLGCPFEGDPGHLITGWNEIHKVEAGDVTFVDVEKYYQKAIESAATTILIDKAVAVPKGKALLISDQPFRDFNRLGDWFLPSKSLATSGTPQLGEGVAIGQHVVFGEDVRIGAHSEIGHNVVIGSDVVIGSHCRIFANSSILDHSRIGDHVTVNSGAVIGSEAFYFKSMPGSKAQLLSKGRVVIGDHVHIGANCTLDRGVSSDTQIGDWTILDNLVQVGHDTVIGERCIIAAQVGISGVVTIGNDVILWGQVGVNKDLSIGDKAVLLGKTGVMSSLDGGKTYLGMIAAEVRQTLREVASLKKLPDILRKMGE
jgi:UDP-3-O-[3-hydroxymyristoyl] glucosamine N-acyltransferase